ncbi:hypothetical protein BB934_45150 (plasmid) [Microvirga ossetica]|uniref:Uncharacterized protein n=1 Tax=Microvirga ossetica TaxID=1882682 RepID=A0A1B2EZI8_9HYPH|nr:hypothetical protein [Microvirga ossetica]ANY85409.1 hypothetical protein BB934_45150 [Microvirga ossetica]
MFKQSIVSIAAVSILAASPVLADDVPPGYSVVQASPQEQPKEQRNSKGQIDGVRIKLKSGWVFECRIPRGGWNSFQRKFFARLKGGVARKQDVDNGPYGRAWYITLEAADYDAATSLPYSDTFPMTVHIDHADSGVWGAHAIDLELCDEKDNRIARIGTVHPEGRWRSSEIIAADYTWINPFDKEGDNGLQLETFEVADPDEIGRCKE